MRAYSVAMALNSRTRRALLLTARISLVATALGAIFGMVVSPFTAGSAASGALTGFAVALPLTLIETLVLYGGSGHALRRLPFRVLLGLRAVLYLGVSLGAYVLSRALIDGIGAVSPHEPYLLWSLGFSLIFGVAVNFVMLLRRLAGPGAIANFVLGRYHRPRTERRALLFLDVAGSTAITERIGAERFHALLNAVMFDIAGPVLECGGEIQKYVGDEAIITWPEPGQTSGAIRAGTVGMQRQRLGHATRALKGRF